MCYCSLSKAAVLLSFLFSLAVNAAFSTGAVTGQSIGDISNEFPTYVTPDGLTFSIWAVIYTLELVMVLRQPDGHGEALMEQQCPVTGLSVRWRLVLTFLANALWLPVYSKLFFGAALLVIIIYLKLLLSVYSDLNTKTAANFCEWFTLCAGIACNTSWLIVATCANAFTFAGVKGWQDQYGVAGTPLAASLVAVAVAIIAIFMATMRSDLAWSLVAAWALAGIFRMQTQPNPEAFPEEAMTRQLGLVAIWSCAVVLVASLAGIFLGWQNNTFSGIMNKGLPLAGDASP